VSIQTTQVGHKPAAVVIYEEHRAVTVAPMLDHSNCISVFDEVQRLCDAHPDDSSWPSAHVWCLWRGDETRHHAVTPEGIERIKQVLLDAS